MRTGKLNSDLANQGLGVGALVGMTARTRAGGTRDPSPTLKQLWQRIKGLGRKPAHRVIDPRQAGDERGYVLQRKGESAQIRLDFLQRLSPRHRGEAHALGAADRVEAGNQAAGQPGIDARPVAVDLAEAEKLAGQSAEVLGAVVALEERVEGVVDLALRLPFLRGSEAHQGKTRFLSERRLALEAILGEFSRSEPSLAPDRRFELSRLLIQLYLPGQTEGLLAGRSWSELDQHLPRPVQGRYAASAAVDEVPSLDATPATSALPQDDASLAVEAPGSFAVAADRAGDDAYQARVGHRDDWPAVSVDPRGFIDSMSRYFERLARTGQMSDRLLERMAERSAGLNANGAWRQEALADANGGAVLQRRLEAADTINAFRAILAPIADPHFVEEFSTAESTSLQRERAQLVRALGDASAAGDAASVALRTQEIGIVDRKLRLLALRQYGRMVDSFFNADAGFASAALTLKQRAVQDLLPVDDHALGLAWVDAQQAQAQGRRALDGWQVSVKGNRWLFGAAGRARKEGALVRGAEASTVIDEALLQAVRGGGPAPLRPGGSSVIPVRIEGGDNTRAMALMIAHQMVLQRQISVIEARLQSGADGPLEGAPPGSESSAAGAAQPPASEALSLRALARLFDDADLQRLGLRADQIRSLRANPNSDLAQMTLSTIEQAAEALYRMGLDGTEKVEVVNRLLQQAIEQVVARANATANARDITAMMPIANARRLIDLGGSVQLPDQASMAYPDAFDSGRERFIVQRNQIAARHGQLRKLDESLALATLELARVAAPLRPDPRKAAHLQMAIAIESFREVSRTATDNARALAELNAAHEPPAGLDADDADRWLEMRQGAIAELESTRDELSVQLAQLAIAIHAGRDTPIGRILWPQGEAPRSPPDADSLSVLLNEKDLAAGREGVAPGPSAVAAAMSALASAPAQRKSLVREIESRSAALQQSLADRRAAMGEGLAQGLQTILRAEIAQHYLLHAQEDRHGAASGTQEALLPIEWRDELLTALSDRGVDTARFAPEIEDYLMREIGSDTIQSWVNEAGKRQVAAAVAVPGSERDTAGAERAVARDAIISAVRDMQFGERIKLTERNAFTLASGRVPIEPSGLRAELAVSRSSRLLLDIKCKGEKFQIVIRGGNMLGGEAGIHWMPPIPGVGHVASLSAKVSGSRESAEGVAISFSSREDTIAFIDALYSRPRLEASDWSKASQIEFTTKTISAVGIEAAASISSRNLGKALSAVNPELGEAMAASWAADVGPVGKVQVGLDLGAGVRFRMGAQWEDAGLVNNRKVVRKLASAFHLGLNVQAGLRIRHPTGASLLAGALSPDPSGAPAAGDGQVASAASPVSAAKSGNDQDDGLTLNKLVPPNAFNLLSWDKELAELNFQVELATEQTAADGHLEKAELEIFVPLMPGLTTATLGKLIPGYADKLSALSEAQARELDGLLDRIDTDHGHGILINLALRPERREALNAQFSSEKQAASLLPSVVQARTGVAVAYRDHQRRLADLKQQPDQFDLSQVIVVASDMMFRSLNTNLVFVKFGHESSAMNGRTVGRIALEPFVAAAAPSEAAGVAVSDDSPRAESQVGTGSDNDLAERLRTLRRYGTV